VTRTRSPEAHEKVVKAALELFGERGIDATSMGAIARESGVSKATIYKHWADKEALLMEVMLYVHGLPAEPQDVDTGDLERMMPTLIAYSAVHREFGQAWRHRVMDPPQQCLKRILRRAVERGLLEPGLDIDVAMALLLGPVMFRRIFEKQKTSGAKSIGPQTAEAFCRAFARQTNAHEQAAHLPRSSARTGRS
jgi:AcrR family transcriptional regulator